MRYAVDFNVLSPCCNTRYSRWSGSKTVDLELSERRGLAACVVSSERRRLALHYGLATRPEGSASSWKGARVLTIRGSSVAGDLTFEENSHLHDGERLVMHFIK
jgi:hypothetical protein